VNIDLYNGMTWCPIYLGMQPEPVSTARSPSFWPGPAWRSLGPGCHSTGL
jgi:hypothetical protein